MLVAGKRVPLVQDRVPQAIAVIIHGEDPQIRRTPQRRRCACVAWQTNRDDEQSARRRKQEAADDGARQRCILFLASAAIAIGIMPTTMAAAVISTGRILVRPASSAARNALRPLSCCSRANVTSRMEFADATPTAIIRPHQ